MLALFGDILLKWSFIVASYAILLFPFGKVSLNGGNIVYPNYGYMVFLVNTLVKVGVLCTKVVSIWQNGVL